LYQSEHILPEPFIRNLEPLCQEAPKTEFESVKALIEKEFGQKFEEVFDYFEEKPLGSASIAQVHKARLRDSHEYVAIKIQHPMIAVHCPSDVAITKLATRVGEFLWPGIKLQWISKEFDLNIFKEIDFTNESKNSEKIKNFFKNDERIVVPRINWKYTTKKVITMSFEEGRSIVDTKFRAENQIKAEEVANLLTDVFYKQIFRFGFVHADPHPGNLFIRKELVNGRNITRLILLDHGLYRELDKEFVYNYALLWRGVFMQNPQYITRACHYFNVNKPELFTSIVTNRNYNEVMNKTVKFDTNKRLGRAGRKIL
jgi:aarF domain-containing kinase